jgi:hypothetical protein
MKIRNKITNTYPIAFHLSGKKIHNRFGWNLWEEFKKNISDQCMNLTNETLRDDVSVCFMSYGYDQTQLMEQSLKYFNIEYNNIAENNEINNKLEFGELQLAKCKLLFDFLQKNKTKYVIGWDVTDVFFIDHPNRIVEKFENEFNCEMLMNAEIKCWPKQARYVYRQLERKHDYETTLFKYLNSGLFIAKSEFYMQIYEELINKPALGNDIADQAKFHQIYLDYFPRLQLDMDCKIFQNTGRVDPTIFEIEK